jgi:hypothetical protein
VIAETSYNMYFMIMADYPHNFIDKNGCVRMAKIRLQNNAFDIISNVGTNTTSFATILPVTAKQVLAVNS